MLSARVLGFGLLALSVLPYSYYWYAASKMALFVSCMLVLFGCAACWRIRANPDTLAGKHVVVTGCDSGIGLALCEALANHGAVVYAGCLSLQSKGAQRLARLPGVRTIKMDVTNNEDIAAAFDCVDASLGDSFLWAVVCNAGVQFNGDLELTTEAQCRRIMDVNYFGLLKVSQVFLPLLRERPGRLVLVSSVRGLCSWPLVGAYTASKFAVEALADAWRLELSRFGLPVSLVQPSHFGGVTEMLGDTERVVKELAEQWEVAEPHVRDAYGAEYWQAVQDAVLHSRLSTYPTLQPVVEALLEALASYAPRDRYLVPGTDSRWIDVYKWTAIARSWLPASVHDNLLWRQTLRHLPLPKSAEIRARALRRGWFD